MIETPDSSVPDAGRDALDSGAPDAGSNPTRQTDGGEQDAGPADAGARDAGWVDAGILVNDLDSIPAGQWAEVPGSHLRSVAYQGPLSNENVSDGTSSDGFGDVSGVMDDFNGGVLDTDHDRLMVWGGGHHGYYGNEIYAFDLNTLRWVALDAPTDVVTYWNGRSGTISLPGGAQVPSAPHTYDVIQYLPNRGMFIGDSAGGAISGASGLPGVTDVNGWLFDVASNVWADKADRAGCGGGIGGSSAYDPVTGHYFDAFEAVGGCTGSFMEEYDPVADAWSSFSDSYLKDYHLVADIDADDRLFVATGGGQLQAFSLASTDKGHELSLVVTGDLTAQNTDDPGFVWYPPGRRFVAWSGGSTLYLLDPATWAWSAHPAAPGSAVPTAANPEGTYGRFRYDAAHNVFVIVNSVDEDVYAYKPDF